MAVAAGASGIAQIQRQALGLGVRWTEAVDDGKGKRWSRHHQTNLQIPSCSGSCDREACMVSDSFVRLTGEVQERTPPPQSCTAPSLPRSSLRWSSSSGKRGTRRASVVMSTIIVPVWMRGGKRGGWAAPCRAASMSGPSSAQEDWDQGQEDQQGVGQVGGRNLSSPLSDDNEEGTEEDQAMERRADGTNLSSVGLASVSSSSIPPSPPPPPPPPPPLTSSSLPPRASSSPPPPTPPPDSPVLDNTIPRVEESSPSATASSLPPPASPPPSPPHPPATPSTVLSIATDTESDTESDTEVNTESDMAVVAAEVVVDNVAAVLDKDAPGLDSDADSPVSVVSGESTNGSYVQLAVDLVGKSDDDSDERGAGKRETSTAEGTEVSEGVRTSVDVTAGAHSDTDTDTDSSTTATASGKRLSAFQPSAANPDRNERNASSQSGASAGGRRAKRGKNISDYIRIVSEYLKNEKGPPRWFAPIDAEPQRDDAPLMLFLPGIEGTGFSLLLQHESLKRYFELWCLSTPPSDRTPFRELVDLVRTTVENEHKLNPRRAIYLLGESFGGCLALAAASELKDVYLHLILINPATSFEESPLKPLFPLMGTLPANIFPALPYLLWPAFGDPLRLATAGFEGSLQPWDRMWNIRDRLVQMLPELGEISNLLPKECLLWKLQLLKEGAAFANSRLGDIEAPALILASGKDNVLPSTEEATRLKAALKTKSRIRTFEDGGHCLLLEEVLNLGVLIRATGMYRRTKKDEDEVECFVPPTDDEVKIVRAGFFSFMRQVASPVFLSTNRETEEVEFGLRNIPEDRPLLLIGNHQIMGSELFLLTEELWCEANVMVRGLAHPLSGVDPSEGNFVAIGDLFRLFGAVPSTGPNLYKLLARKEVALLYPGGVREAFKRRGERNMVMWPEQPEFVRMAIRHGATILPFAGIGGDDAFDFIFDTDEMAKLPFVGENMARDAQKVQVVRKVKGDDIFLPPIIVPRIGTRMYYFFRKPISTKGLYEAGALSDRELVKDIYQKVKSEVEGGIDFLLEKREQDPYNNFLARMAYESIMPGSKAPAFRL